MSISTVVTSAPATRAASPIPATPLATRFAAAGRAIWRALEETGRARALNELIELAERCEPQQPGLAKTLRAASRRVAQS